MQFMYLRRKGKKNNLGRHPIGMIGVHKMDSGDVIIGVQMVHSKDRFEKVKGRELLTEKILKDRVALLTAKDDIPALYAILPDGIANRLDDYPRHQEILERLVKDEFSGGSWSKSAKT